MFIEIYPKIIKIQAVFALRFYYQDNNDLSSFEKEEKILAPDSHARQCFSIHFKDENRTR